MSVIIAIKDKNRIVVGVDSRMSSCDSYFDSYSRRPKAIHINEKRDIIVGGVGNIGLVDVIKQILAEHPMNEVYSLDRNYIVKYIIPALVVNVRDYEMSDKENKMDGILLIAVKDRAYMIMGNYSVEEVDGYAAEGSGREAALGSLYTSNTLYSMSPEDRIRLAIEATGSCVSTVSTLSFIGDTAGKVFRAPETKNPQKH